MAKNVKPECLVLRTGELSDARKNGVIALFERVFQREKTPQMFARQFAAVEGGAYHCIIEKAGVVVAAQSCIPYCYYCGSQKIKIALGVDTAVAPDAKIGGFGVFYMFEALFERMKADGVSAVYGFPNDNFYDYNVNIIGFSDIGILDFYILPLNPGYLKKTFSFLNPLVRFSARLFCRAAALFASSGTVGFMIEKVDDEAFRTQRYDERHHRIKLKNGCEVVYMLYNEERFGQVAYIVDISGHSARNFYLAFAAVSREVGAAASMIVYPCRRLPFGMPLHVPIKYLPRKLRMVGNILGDSIAAEDFHKLENWNANLSIFDVR